MRISDKLRALAAICGSDIKPVSVSCPRRLLGIPFLNVRCTSQLWVSDDGDWWRVMFSPKHFQFLGADFRKGGDSPPLKGDFIAWKRIENEWS